MTRESDDTDEGYGITDEDLDQIAAYLRKPTYERSIDDLQHCTEE